MTWTTEVPTKPGKYWVKYSDNSTALMCVYETGQDAGYIYGFMNTEYMESRNEMKQDAKKHGFKFYGPIEPPKEGG